MPARKQSPIAQMKSRIDVFFFKTPKRDQKVVVPIRHGFWKDVDYNAAEIFQTKAPTRRRAA
jgi:hypothetical protein